MIIVLFKNTLPHIFYSFSGLNHCITSVLGKQVPKRNFSSPYMKQSYRLPSVQNVFCCLLWCLVGIVQPKADPWCCLHFTKYKFNVYRKI
ncbi:hypothetical protein F3B56_27790 [Bacteroides ovatus]|nr:hypothetical protein F3B56_27790 [Bacteroides ovatus]